MSFAYHLHVMVCRSYARMYPYVIPMLLVCYPYITRMYSYVIRLSLVLPQHVLRDDMICSWFYREPLLLGPNSFFPLTRFFCDTYHLMNNNMKSFVYVFVTNCQFSQITLPEYAP